jgi:glycosyltransferase involved in cell wall biosynthesis
MTETQTLDYGATRPKSRSATIPRILVVGQTPPPVHGQSVMLAMLLEAPFTQVQLHHVRMAFSKSLDEVGQFRLTKFFHLFSVIAHICFARIWHGVDILYYPPSGPNRIPMWRDIVILNCTRWMFRKTIFHMHASGVSELYPKLGGIGKWLYRRAYFHVDAMIRSCDLVPNDALGLHTKRDYLIPNGTEDVWSGYGEEQKRSTHEGCRILYLGTVCRTKGILDLLEACRILKSKNIPFQVDVVGGFQPSVFESEVRAKIAEFGLADLVTIWGQQVGEAKWQRLAAATVFCFPSYYESETFPCVLVEALSFGIPVVAANWRGIPSIVAHGVHGLLVPPKDSDALAKALAELITDPARGREMGIAGRARYLAEFTPKAHLEAMEQTLASICLGDIRTP